MSDSPYVQFYTSDFLAGTGGMTASTKGVYITLLCLMYEAETPLHQSWSLLARRCGCTLSAFKKAIAELEDDGKVTCSDEGLWSPKCEKHIKFRRDRRDSAKAAAEKRWEKSQQKQQKADATASPAHCQPEPEPEPEPDKEDTDVSLSPASDPMPANDLAHCVSRYNAAAEASGWPQIAKLTPARSKVLKARIKDAGGVEGWEVALRKAHQSDFLCGRTHKQWTGFSFDWLTKSGNFTKLMEGNYDNRDRNPAGRSAAQSGFSDGFAAVAQRYDNERRADGSGHV